MADLTIDILISTIGKGIEHVQQVLLPPAEGVRYIVSLQMDEEETMDIPDVLSKRTDVDVAVMKGRGLCRNRNNTLRMATADICVTADDDNRYSPQNFERIREAYRRHPEADIICFAATGYDGKPMKKYPQGEMTYCEAVRRGYYPASIEMTMRRQSVVGKVEFNTSFGLGSPHYCAGEEEVFMHDAMSKGLTCLFVNEVIVRTDPDTTGQSFLTSPCMQTTKGAVFRHCYGLTLATWRTIKESLWWCLHRKANPLHIFRNMMKGVLDTSSKYQS